jgi:hypothetical protein
MQTGPIQVPAPSGGLVIAGATGALGNEVVRRLVGQFGVTHVLARQPIKAGLRGVAATVVDGDDPAAWPPLPATTGIVLFDPPRLFHDRERALWTPAPEQLPAVAQWLRRSGVTTLAVVLPHAQGRLPEALKRGLASLDEHAVAALGFERMLVVRSARKPGASVPRGLMPRIAHAMLSSLKYMVPASEQPVRAQKVADFVSQALRAAPPGIHVAAPELVWRAAQGDTAATVRQWLQV